MTRRRQLGKTRTLAVSHIHKCVICGGYRRIFNENCENDFGIRTTEGDCIGENVCHTCIENGKLIEFMEGKNE